MTILCCRHTAAVKNIYALVNTWKARCGVNRGSSKLNCTDFERKNGIKFSFFETVFCFKDGKGKK